MIGTRGIRGLAVVAGLLVGGAVAFGGVAYADDDDGGDYGRSGDDGYARAQCDHGWINGGGSNTQCQSRYGSSNTTSSY
ncbi:hypothetical protein [Pseudonocardia acaciae]|uniref:hypothetical protein n=1 Tax=Pseudonocardia acaciae TaxID=551276 RepID=UPI000B0635B1|nr:hypothetical protein [Pseudonocardia acaciae]